MPCRSARLHLLAETNRKPGSVTGAWLCGFGRCCQGDNHAIGEGSLVREQFAVTAAGIMEDRSQSVVDGPHLVPTYSKQILNDAVKTMP